jgi:hypothetical protein
VTACAGERGAIRCFARGAQLRRRGGEGQGEGTQGEQGEGGAPVAVRIGPPTAPATDRQVLCLYCLLAVVGDARACSALASLGLRW